MIGKMIIEKKSFEDNEDNFDEMITIIMTMIRKMTSGSTGSAPRFATHQSCHPHSCHLKEVQIIIIMIIIMMMTMMTFMPSIVRMMSFPPDGFQNTET